MAAPAPATISARPIIRVLLVAAGLGRWWRPKPGRRPRRPRAPPRPPKANAADVAVSSIRDRVPSSLATQAAWPLAAISLGARSTPIGTTAATPRVWGSMRVTVAVLRLSTHTAPALAAMRVGNGALSPARATSATRSVTASVAGSIRSTVARRALIAHTAPAPTATPSSGRSAGIALTARVAGSTRTSRRDPSVIHTPPAPTASDAVGAPDRGGGSRRNRIGRCRVGVAQRNAHQLAAAAVGHPPGSPPDRQRVGRHAKRNLAQDRPGARVGAGQRGRVDRRRPHRVPRRRQGGRTAGQRERESRPAGAGVHPRHRVGSELERRTPAAPRTAAARRQRRQRGHGQQHRAATDHQRRRTPSLPPSGDRRRGDRRCLGAIPPHVLRGRRRFQVRALIEDLLLQLAQCRPGF